MVKDSWICGRDIDSGQFIYSDLSAAQRFVIEQWEDGDFVIRDRAADGEFCYTYPVMGIKTRKEAEQIRCKLIRGESLFKAQPQS